MHGETEQVFVLLLLALTCSIGLYETKKRISIPTAPFLLLFGFITGLVSESSDLSDWFHIWKSLDYKLVQLLFLPGLIFQAALSLDWYLFKRYLPLIALLTTAGVALTWGLATLAVASLYQWEWRLDCVLGAVLATTDHVAVVAEMKKLHAERRFAILLQGETLVSEALLYVLLQDFLQSSSSFFPLFLRLSCGGIALGLAMSLLMRQVLKQIVDDAIQETVALMTASYVLFFVNEKIQCSGAVSVAVFGMYLSAHGKVSISPSVEHSVQLLWQFFSQSMETIVFFASGVIAGLIVQDREAQASEIWKLPCLLLYILLIRATVVAILFPLMHKIRKTYGWREAAVMAVTGVKGVVAVVFGLIVYHSESKRQIAAEIMLASVCLSACSILISHYLTYLSVHFFGLSSYSKLETLSIVHSVYQLFAESTAQSEPLQSAPQFSDVNWSGLFSLLTPNIILPDLVQRATDTSVIRPRINTEQELLHLVQAAGPLESSEDLTLIRRKFVLIYRRGYWRECERGQCFPTSVTQLDSAAERSLELAGVPLREWEFLQEGLLRGIVPRTIQRLSQMRLVGVLLRSAAQSQLQTAFDVASTFLSVQRSVSSVFRQETAWNQQQLSIIIGESQRQQELCTEFLTANFSSLHLELRRKVQVKKACYAVLMLMRQKTIDAFDCGKIGEENLNRMIATMNRKMKTLDSTVDELINRPKSDQSLVMT